MKTQKYLSFNSILARRVRYTQVVANDLITWEENEVAINKKSNLYNKQKMQIKAPVLSWLPIYALK